MVTIYSKKCCGGCMASKAYMTKHHLAFKEVMVEGNAEAANIIEELGYRSLPVIVVSENNHWSGFRPDLFSALVS